MNKGFTLLELMVTVIIIGILVAVALPQYTKVVNKARLAEAVANLGALQRGIDMYCTQFKCGSGEHVFMKTAGTRLDIDLKGSLSCGASSCDSKYFKYVAGCDTGGCGVSATPFDTTNFPTLSLSRSKNGLTVSWSKLCIDGPAGFCESLESQGYTKK